MPPAPLLFFRVVALPLAIACLGPVDPAGAEPVPLAVGDNPRNARRDGPVLPYLRTDVRAPVPAPGQRRSFPEGATVRWSVAPDPGGAGLPLPPVRFTLDRRPRAPVPDGGPGEATGASVRWTATPRREELTAEIDGDRCVVATDALTVALVVERATLRDGDRRFGSLVRRVRASLDALNALFAASVHPYAPRGVLERFRLDAVEVVDRATVPSADAAPPAAFDLRLVLDDADAFPARLSADRTTIRVGRRRADGASEDPWSRAAEHALWHLLVRSRGVPALLPYAPAAGALPGRAEAAVPLPAPFAPDLATEAAPAPVVGEWTAVVLEQRRGVFRPPPADDPGDPRHGVLWTWLPGRIDLELVRDGGGDRHPGGESGGAGGEGGEAPLSGATVRWWRARRGAGLPEGTAGVAADAPPDGTATADPSGRVALAGDLLGRARPAAERSRWLLLEVEVDGARRFAILSALDLSLAYARGAKYAAPFRLAWERLLVPVR